jgi:hypothetical protein
MSNRHPGENCCFTCEDDKNEGNWYLEGEYDEDVCCCRALNADGSVKPRPLKPPCKPEPTKTL